MTSNIRPSSSTTESRTSQESTRKQRRASGWDEIVGYSGPGSMTWRIGREWALLLGAGRAVLMQLAHPLVAAGVAQHSSFMVDPLGRSIRTVEFTQVMAFGMRAEVHSMARTVNGLHANV